AGVPVPVWNQGVDFSPQLRGQAFTGPEAVLLEMAGIPRWRLDYPDWRGLVTERYKYAYYDTGEEFLYDLQEDPYELRNLAPTGCLEFRQRLLRLLAETR